MRAGLPQTEPYPPLSAVVPVFARIGLLSFGGPAGQIALMHRELVERRAWVEERRFLDALSFCMLLPGPEAMQLATWCGWRLHGVVGGFLAGALFVLPGAVLIAALAAAYLAWGQTQGLAGVFIGVQAAVLAIVLNALIALSKRALTQRLGRWIAVTALVAIFVFAVPFPVIVLSAALLGALYAGDAASASSTRQAPARVPAASVPTSLAPTGRGPALGVSTGPSPGAGQEPATASGPATASEPAGRHWRLLALTVVLGLAAWWLPLAAVAGWFGMDHVLTQLALFCSRLAVVTFGGAYAVLAYMAQDVVAHHQWMTAPEMMDGLGLAETTPGPLILVTQFVATVAAWREGVPPGWAMGLAGWAVSLWATFVPCFLWVFAGAPYIDVISSRPRLRAALDAITAAVVGVMANLGLWFGLHLCFGGLEKVEVGPASVLWPQWSSVQTMPVMLAIGGYIALRRGLPVVAIIAGSAIAAWLVSLSV